MRSTFFKGVVLGATVSMLVLAATTALAGSGVGGIFNLGVTNTVDQKSTLRGNTNDKLLNVENTNAAGAAAVGIFGRSVAPQGVGVFGSATGGTGVRGAHTATTGTAPGVRGATSAPDSFGGVFQNSTAGAGTAGVGLMALGRGHNQADTGIGPDGFDGGIEAAGPNGVEGNSDTPGGFGVSGDGPAVGVNGTATDTAGTGGRFTGGATGTGVKANGGTTGVDATGGAFGVDSNVSASGAVGVRSTTGSSANDAVQGNTSGGISDAIQGTVSGSGAFALFGIATSTGTAVVASANDGLAVSAGNSNASSPTVSANNSDAGGTAGRFTGDIGVNIDNNDSFGTGLLAGLTGDTDGNGTANDDGNQAGSFTTDDTNSPNALQASNGGVPSDAFTAEAIEAFGFVDINGDARVTGNLDVVGTCCGPLIDNPLDPANSYLRHASVASPDMKNMYDGVVKTDKSGRASVELPDYFTALNKDPRYQLTVIGRSFARAIVWKEIRAGGRTFEIRTDEPNVKVSWQVTGIRNDAYAQAHPLKVIEQKTGAAAGMYLHPELFGFPGLMPLGLDLAAAPKGSAAMQRAQNDLLALIAKKREQALKDASRPAAQAAPVASQG